MTVIFLIFASRYFLTSIFFLVVFIRGCVIIKVIYSVEFILIYKLKKVITYMPKDSKSQYSCTFDENTIFGKVLTQAIQNNFQK